MTAKPTNRFLFFTAILLAVTCSSCEKEISFPDNDDTAIQNISLHFNPTVQGNPFAFGEPYTNALGESFSVRTFKFYISSIDLINTTSQVTYKTDRNNYYLVDFSDTASVTLNPKAIPGTYNQIAFTIGVDSLHNVSGAQTGALDPGNGMFWTWNSGYIMAKLEGNSPLSNQPDQVFEYHIGGFKGEDNVVQKIYLDLPPGSSINTEEGRKSRIDVSADVNKWFDGTNKLSILANPVCMTPGALSKSIADNYAGMFKVEAITNQ